MVCLGNICINTLQKGAKGDDDDDDNNNNNNNGRDKFAFYTCNSSQKNSKYRLVGMVTRI
jgi:hypothetical protein